MACAVAAGAGMLPSLQSEPPRHQPELPCPDQLLVLVFLMLSCI